MSIEPTENCDDFVTKAEVQKMTQEEKDEYFDHVRRLYIEQWTQQNTDSRTVSELKEEQKTDEG